MNFDIEKPKTKKGLSYVLQSSAITEVFEKLGLDFNVIIRYWTPHKIDTPCYIFECELWLPNQNVNFERYYITIAAVKTEYKLPSKLLIEQEVMPQFIAWLENIIQLPDNSTYFRKKIFFRAKIILGKIHIEFS